MTKLQTRRDAMKLMGLGGIVFASRLVGCSSSTTGAPMPTTAPTGKQRRPTQDDFMFLQLSDTHWGYNGPANPEANVTLRDTVDKINALSVQPDFIVFTGDLTHNTDDPAVRRNQMGEFKQIIAKLKIQSIKFLPGEHDAGADRGEAFRENFGNTHYSFDHKGIHFIALDNVSDPGAAVGTKQIAWLDSDLKKVDHDRSVVVFAHRPLFDLYPDWDWATQDGERVMAVLSQHPNVTVFYGHIHQVNHHMTGAIAHHSAQSLAFALPAPGSMPKRTPVPWNPAKPFAGLGYRKIQPDNQAKGFNFEDISISRDA